MKKEEYMRGHHLPRRRGKLIIIFFCFVFLFCFCRNEDKCSNMKKYGVGFNKERKAIGLATLKSDWICFPQTESGRYIWIDPTIDILSVPIKGSYKSKITFLLGDSLISESDIYIYM